MFSGIVAAVGRIVSVTPLGPDRESAESGVRLRIEAGELDLADVQLGDSIAVQGACMTVVEFDTRSFAVDVSRESLQRTVGLSEPGEVNLEKSLALGDRLGGHLVTGHVDGLGRVLQFEPFGESWRLRIEAPTELARFFAYKGSATVNGVSLTVNKVEDQPSGSVHFEINIIPHTLQVTTLRHLKTGDQVNLEIDLIARYCERLLSTRSVSGAGLPNK